MGFPKAPKPKSPPNMAQNADASKDDVTPINTGAATLINTTPTGLSRKANTQKTSLLGG